MKPTGASPLRIALAVLCLGGLIPVGNASADGFELVGQYMSDGNTTMTIHETDDGVVISGRGEYSMYNAACRVTGDRTAECRGKGTRLKDRKAYQATYRLKASRNGRSLTSRWTATYRNGESYSGTTRLTRID